MTDPVDSILQKALDGERVSYEEGVLLYRDAPREALAETAHRLRRKRTDPAIVTYLVDRNVNYTNFCTTNCLFCAFYRPMGHEEGYVLDFEEIAAKLEELSRIGGTRVLLQGGHHPDLPLSWYTDMLRFLRQRFPHIQLDAFSPSEIENIAEVEDSTMEEVLAMLAEAGQGGLPGGGAEILVDEVRQRISRKKQSADGWLRAMEIAQELGLTTSATMVIGFGETVEQRVLHLERLRAHQERARESHGNGFTSFISWTFQPENTALGRIGEKKGRDLGADGEAYLRHAAFCRIYLDNFEHHQASWPTQGRDVARRALACGCDDFGSTMMEENVVSSAGSKHSALAESSILEEIVAAGYRPVQRDSNYRLVNATR
jgi:cyclic dehypoxanthinyl futalosine synthase